MKRILVLAIFALISGINAYCDIAKNGATTAGERRILTDSKKIAKIENGKITLALGIKVNKGDTLLAFVAFCDANLGHQAFIKGDKILIRLTDDSVIELTNVIDVYESTEKATVSQNYETSHGFVYAYGRFGAARYVPYASTQLVPEVNVEKVETSYGLYPITKQQMVDMYEKGFKKFRIQVEDCDVDVEGGKAKCLTKEVRKMADDIKSALLISPDRSDF